MVKRYTVLGVPTLIFFKLSFVYYLFGKTRQGETRILDLGWILIRYLIDNRLRHVSGPVHIHRLRYIKILTEYSLII